MNPTTRSTTNIGTTEEKRFMDNLLKEKPNRIAIHFKA